jgi:cysteine-S-conjugate beta-lyase
MPDDARTPRRPDRSAAHDWHTRLSHAGRAGTAAHGFVNPAVHRGSTVLNPTVGKRRGSPADRLDQVLVYGTHGTPTHWPLEDLVCEIEGGTRCQLVSTGLAAITVPLLAFLSAGDHLLLPDSVYGPTRQFAEHYLARMNIATTYYDPMIAADALRALFRPETKVLFLESPGSHTFEVQDVPALAAVAHERGAKVLLDNTWGIHYFQPFRHGVDVSIQALTKYLGGHSDLLLGGIIVNDAKDWERVRLTTTLHGHHAGPDEVWLGLRGARTLAVRLDRQMQSGLTVARWLAERPEVLRVLHPALPSCPGHDIWKRDFTGASSLFGVVFRPEFEREAVHAMVESLELFGIGASWGGYESLALPTSLSITRTCGTGQFGGEAVRLHIGLEEPADLIADLEHGFAVMRDAA